MMAMAGTIAFAYVMGLNDGASLIAANLPSRSLGGIGSALILSMSVAVTPLFVGLGVAETVSFRLVGFGGPHGQTIALVGVGVAIGLVLVMSRMALPTSLTLALIGAIVGSGIGAGASVDARPVIGVLVTAAAAPIAAGVVAGTLRKFLNVADRVPARRSKQRWVHSVSFLFQSIAYGANDGQKAFAVVLIVFGVSQQPQPAFEPAWWAFLGVAGVFFAGSVTGMRHARRGLGSRLAPERVHHSIVAQFASATSVGASALVGMPVSMTQACAAGLVGSTAAESPRRVRWEQAVRLMHAWLLTLPASLAIGVAAGAVARVLHGE